MTDLEQLLHQAGHRRAAHGKNWICRDCPPSHAPALSVKAEVYYCHRCGKGGNLVLLKKELGILEHRPPQTQDQRLEAECLRLLHAEACRIHKEESQRLNERHCWLVNQIDGVNKMGAYQCHTDGAPAEQTLLLAGHLNEQLEIIQAQIEMWDRVKPEDVYHLAEEHLLLGG